MQNDSPYPTKRRRNESRLSAHLEAIIEMYQQGYSLVMMQEYLASNGICVNPTTIWRYIKKKIARRAGQSNKNTQITASLSKVNNVEAQKALFYQQNSTDNSLQKSTLEKLNDLSNAENEF